MTEPWDDLDSAATLADISDGGQSSVQALPGSGQQAVARAALVNRTRRVVRGRAHSMQVRKSRMRSLYIPLLVSAGLVAAVMFALWNVLEGYDANSTGLPDPGQQIMVLLMWCLPASAALLAAVWVHRAGPTFDDRTGNGRPQ